MLKFIKNLMLFFKKRKSPTWQEHYEILSKVFLEGVQDGLKSKVITEPNTPSKVGKKLGRYPSPKEKFDYIKANMEKYLAR